MNCDGCKPSMYHNFSYKLVEYFQHRLLVLSDWLSQPWLLDRRFAQVNVLDHLRGGFWKLRLKTIENPLDVSL